MKRFKFNTLMLAVVALGFVFVSCSKDEEPVAPNPIQGNNFNDLKNSAELDQTLSQLGDYIAKVADENKVANGSKSEEFVPVCGSISVRAEGSIVKIVRIFDANGCYDQLDGHTYKGKIEIDYELNSENMQTITYKLTGFYVDDKSISGGGKIVDVFSNHNQLPQRTHEQNLTLTWSNGFKVNRTGEIIGVVLQGLNTPYDKMDDIVELTGWWHDTIANIYTNKYSILTALRHIGTCWSFVSGTVDVNHRLGHGVIDFGTGDCDGEALLTMDGGMTYVIKNESNTED